MPTRKTPTVNQIAAEHQMEPESIKAVVFGIGGAGCRIVSGLASTAPKNTDIVALDKDKAQLDALDQNIKKVLVGESLADCGSFEEMKRLLGAEMSTLENSLNGANLAVVIASAAGRISRCAIRFITELCKSKGVFTLAILLHREKLSFDEPILKSIHDNTNGVLGVDNSVTENERSLPISEMYDRVNSNVIDLVTLIITSVSGTGSMNLNGEELAHFFQGEFYFSLASGNGPALLEAANTALGAVNATKVSRVLALVSTPSEASLEDMRTLNDKITEKLSPEYVKWISAYSADEMSKVLLICGASEAQELEKIETAEVVEQSEEEPTPAEVAPVHEIVEIPKKESALERMAREAGGPPNRASRPKLPGSYYLSYKGVVKETKPFTNPALLGLDGRVPTRNPRMPKEEEGPPPSFGMRELKKAVGKRIVENRRDEGGEEFNNVASELVGDPVVIKKKGQKSLEDYKDDLDIGYI